MQSREPKFVKLLVTDYDNCAVLPSSTRPDQLSPTLVKHAKSGDFSGFYGCTHRAYATINPLYWLSSWFKGYDKAALESNFPTYQVTQHFEAATGLPCLGVSTLDDTFYPECGTGYNNLLKPYETTGQLAPASAPYVSFAASAYKYCYTKNPQLAQIARHAKEHFPDANIELDYFDDMRPLCDQALTATQEPNWPSNVNLRIFHHVANNSESAPITEVLAPDKAASSMLLFGLFAYNTPKPVEPVNNNSFSPAPG